MTVALLLISGLYALFTGTLWITWLRMPTFRPETLPTTGPAMTVVVPVRNEAENIGYLLDDLARQTYACFEVIVADDASTDDTLAILHERARRTPYALHILPLTDAPTVAPKKRAISQSIARATGHLIVTTDGDCRVGPHWLATLATYYGQTHARLIAGPVTFTTNNTLAGALQTVEFASLIGSGACTMALGRPTMANGANLCYEKQAFEQVNGFAGVDHLASGDDELLMHKIARQYPGGVRFLKSPAAIVRTAPHRSWRAFYYQRKRWAGKWRAYDHWLPTGLAVFVFLSNAAFLVAGLAGLLNFLNPNVALAVVGLKVVPEFLFLRQILFFLRSKKASVLFIPLTQLLYPFYVVFFGLVAQGKTYRWKGRRLS